tara:strand:- start:608 stop:781 length:174 start_codon:yes stop_codon:yes gene_type:complete
MKIQLEDSDKLEIYLDESTSVTIQKDPLYHRSIRITSGDTNIKAIQDDAPNDITLQI